MIGYVCLISRACGVVKSQGWITLFAKIYSKSIKPIIDRPKFKREAQTNILCLEKLALKNSKLAAKLLTSCPTEKKRQSCCV